MNQNRLYDYMDTQLETDMPPEDDMLLQTESKVEAKTTQQSMSQAAQKIMARTQSGNRAEASSFKQMMRYSPFYLKRHPEERQKGDISFIQEMSESASPDGDELAAVENVFEKNMGSFDRLVSHSDASH